MVLYVSLKHIHIFIGERFAQREELNRKTSQECETVLVRYLLTPGLQRRDM